jgi:hypothetical protein
MPTQIPSPYRQSGAWITVELAVILVLGMFSAVDATIVHEEQGRTFIVDQTGERWEVTQAAGLGFRPEGFQFGIGRNAIRPLAQDHLKADGQTLPGQTRIIGIDNESEAHAYSVQRLTRHEIANTQLGDTPIAAAY